MKIFLLVLFFLPMCGCAAERLYVKLYDQDGNPATNVMVRVNACNSKTYHVYWGDRGCDYSDFYARSQTNGIACVKFKSPSGSFWWWVEDENYYKAPEHKVTFKSSEIWIPGTTRYLVMLHEHTKSFEEVIWKKKNPHPMYCFGEYTIYLKEIKTPQENGKFGFDLYEFDWLPPHGKGKVVDFYYVRERKNANVESASCVSNLIEHIEFSEGGGGYIKKKNMSAGYKTSYEANVNETYLNKFPILARKMLENGREVTRRSILTKDEYMVIRTRVKYDEAGNLVSAYYGKILGSFSFNKAPCIKVTLNAEPNDTNLEYGESINDLKKLEKETRLRKSKEDMERRKQKQEEYLKAFRERTKQSKNLRKD